MARAQAEALAYNHWSYWNIRVLPGTTLAHANWSLSPAMPGHGIRILEPGAAS